MPENLIVDMQASNVLRQEKVYYITDNMIVRISIEWIKLLEETQNMWTNFLYIVLENTYALYSVLSNGKERENYRKQNVSIEWLRVKYINN